MNTQTFESLEDIEKKKVDTVSAEHLKAMFEEFAIKGINLPSNQTEILAIAFHYGMIAGFSVCNENLKKVIK